MALGIQMCRVTGSLEIFLAEILIAYFNDTTLPVVVQYGNVVFATHLPDGLAYLLEPGIVAVPGCDVPYPGMRTLFPDVVYQQLQGVPEHL